MKRFRKRQELFNQKGDLSCDARLYYPPYAYALGDGAEVSWLNPQAEIWMVWSTPGETGYIIMDIFEPGPLR